MSAKDDFETLKLLRQRLKDLPPEKDIAADLIRDEIKKLVANMSYGDKAESSALDKPSANPFGGCKVVGVAPSGGRSDGGCVHVDDLNDGDIISDSTSVGFGPRGPGPEDEDE